jgi:hypothetical protein
VQEFLQPECTVVHEACKGLKQRSRWVIFHPNIQLIGGDSETDYQYQPWDKQRGL